MNLIAVLAALGLEQWRALRWRAALEQLFVRYVRAVEHKLNGGTVQQGAIAAAAAVLPPVLFAVGVYFALDAAHPLLGLLWNIVALYLLMGFRRFSHVFTDVQEALSRRRPRRVRGARWRRGAARRPRELSSSEVAKLAIERGLLDSYRQVFAALFWFTVLPGPAGAVLYRAAVLLADEWRGDPPRDRDDADRAARARLRRAGAGPARGSSTGFRCG